MSPLDLKDWNLREIKSQPLSEKELESLKQKAGSYEALFSRRSTQIKARGIDLATLKEENFKELLLDHYSFLKRPVFETDSEVFIGTDKANLEELDEYFKKS